jgi:hypothetical protein
MKPRFRRAAAWPMLIFSLALAACNPCRNKLRSVTESPDHARLAIVFERGCGATTGFITGVSVLRKGQELGDKASNVFAGEAMDVHASWEANGALVVNYAARARVFFRAVRVNGTSVRYQPYDVAPWRRAASWKCTRLLHGTATEVEQLDAYRKRRLSPMPSNSARV